jgi:hypothetical protein
MLDWPASRMADGKSDQWRAGRGWVSISA